MIATSAMDESKQRVDRPFVCVSIIWNLSIRHLFIIIFIVLVYSKLCYFLN